MTCASGIRRTSEVPPVGTGEVKKHDPVLPSHKILKTHSVPKTIVHVLTAVEVFTNGAGPFVIKTLCEILDLLPVV